MRILPYQVYQHKSMQKMSFVTKPSFSSQNPGDVVINDFMNFLKENNLYLAYDKNHKIAPFENGLYHEQIRIEMRSNNHPKEPLKYFNSAVEMPNGKVEIKGDYFKDRNFGIYGEGKTIRAAIFDMMEKHAGKYFSEQSTQYNSLKKFPDFYDIEK